MIRFLLVNFSILTLSFSISKNICFHPMNMNTKFDFISNNLFIVISLFFYMAKQLSKVFQTMKEKTEALKMLTKYYIISTMKKVLFIEIQFQISCMCLQNEIKCKQKKSVGTSVVEKKRCLKRPLMRVDVLFGYCYSMSIIMYGKIDSCSKLRSLLIFGHWNMNNSMCAPQFI